MTVRFGAPPDYLSAHGPVETGAGVSGSLPLEGCRVLDLGTRIAAPFCAGLLGEMGAEVIKVEQPQGGDFMRSIGPFVAPAGDPAARPDYSLFWAVEGRGRKSVTLDLRREVGQQLFRRLAATADVVVENFRPGTLERWNIAPPDLDPHLVVVRISAYGQDGPAAGRPGLDRTGIAHGGLLHLTGHPDRPPVRVGVTITDYLAGALCAHAAVAALYARDLQRSAGGEAGGTGGRSGQGAVIDGSLYGAALRVLEWTLPAYDLLGTVRERQGNRLENSAPLDNYASADGRFVCIVGAGDANFARLCAAMERPDLTTDERFATLARRAEHGDEINHLVAKWVAGLDAAEVEARCMAHGVPVATAYSAADVFADPHIAARGDLVEVDDPVAGPMRQQAPYPRLAGRPPDPPAGAPRLGEHTDQVLQQVLGLTDDDLARLRADGVV
jgi:crotonobetainyl-CoA:carnitine CoA-transferase CaiB-like acyl-CoA transferase